jgi:hypothetical protein
VNEADVGVRPPFDEGARVQQILAVIVSAESRAVAEVPGAGADDERREQPRRQSPDVTTP